MTTKRLLAASVLLLVLSACGGPAGVTVGGAMMVKEKTIVENASAADNLKTLVAGVKSAKLDATLSGAGPFTVFAPTDQAFATLPAGTVQALMKPENNDLLSQLLTYHVVAGKFTAADLKDGAHIKTLAGKDIVVSNDGKGVVKINGMLVSIADVPASNGVVHVLDGVLLPPAGDAPDMTDSSSSMSASSASGGAMMMDHSSSATGTQPTAAGVMLGVEMDNGVMYRLLDNGSKEEMKTEMQLQNGIKVKPDGTLTSPDGRTAKLENGQVLAINGQVGNSKDGLPKVGSSSSASPSAAKPAGPEYGVYTEGVIGNGQTSVLFFHASWCPECKADDAKLAQWYGQETLKYPTYRVDYDTSGPLKQKYGVTSQHTYVLIDGTGKVLKTLVGPTEDALHALVRGS